MDEWVSQEAAGEWLARERGLSIGGAEASIGDALASGKVRITARLGNLPASRVSAQDLRRFPAGLLYRDVSVSLDDLRRQLGIPKPRRPKPEQDQVNRVLLALAEESERPLKQSDAAARAELDGIGATYQQRVAAFRNLPAQHRYRRGKPPATR